MWKYKTLINRINLHIKKIEDDIKELVDELRNEYNVDYEVGVEEGISEVDTQDEYFVVVDIMEEIEKLEELKESFVRLLK